MAKLYTVQEAAERMRLSPATIYRLLDKGELIAVRINSAVRIAPFELDRFIQDRMAASMAYHEDRRSLRRGR